jgi:hypothetical protein
MIAESTSHDVRISVYDDGGCWVKVGKMVFSVTFCELQDIAVAAAESVRLARQYEDEKEVEGLIRPDA